jgi:hypothetical protein
MDLKLITYKNIIGNHIKPFPLYLYKTLFISNIEKYILIKCHVLLNSRWSPFFPYLADSSEQLCVREREREKEKLKESKRKIGTLCESSAVIKRNKERKIERKRERARRV